ncbi:MAG: cytochrome C [Planctomycetes bacterium]|nr:cytochrome C [Planctomycetota bacterium]
MKRLLYVAIGALAVQGVVLYFVMTGPYMLVQEHIRTFQAPMPPTPPGAVPVEDAFPPLPTPAEARTMPSPVPATADSVARGKVYYAYYCGFCHGEKGDGRGPVGESFVPPAPDLRTPRVAAYSDGQLLRAMLTGVGHEPVLAYTVLPQHRWHLVHYVRTFPKPAPRGVIWPGLRFP